MLCCISCGTEVNSGTAWRTGQLCNVCMQTKAMDESSSGSSGSVSCSPPMRTREKFTWALLVFVGCNYYALSNDIFTVGEAILIAMSGLGLAIVLRLYSALMDKMFGKDD